MSVMPISTAASLVKSLAGLAIRLPRHLQLSSLDSTWEAKYRLGDYPQMQLLPILFLQTFFGELFVLVGDGLPLVL